MVSFYVMGDVPYSIKTPEELPEQERADYEFLRAEEHHIARHLVGMNKDDTAAFGVHVGDIKRGGWPCEEAFYLKTWALLRGSHIPMFILPGDNEWNDCERPTEAWAYWHEYFHEYDMLWPHGLAVERRAAEQPDDFGVSFMVSDVLFVGINLTGTSTDVGEEFLPVAESALAWIVTSLEKAPTRPTRIVIFSHATIIGGGEGGVRGGVNFDHFVGGLSDWTNEHKIPTFYINGDAHKWDLDAPAFRSSPYLARLTIDEGGSAPPVRITVTSDDDRIFVIDRSEGFGSARVYQGNSALRRREQN